MLRNLYPQIYVDSLRNLPLEWLWEKGIRAFILDLDNTLTEWNSYEVPEDLKAWLAEVKERGFRVCLLSNNGRHRVKKVADPLGVPYVPRAGKPRRRSFLRAVEMLKARPEETAVVGDQVFTDVFGGNRCGLFTVLVKPLAQREFLGTRLMRRLERLAVKKIEEAVRNGKINVFAVRQNELRE